MVKKIMIIDDEPDIQLYLMALLEDHGYEASTLSGGENITQAVRRIKPDLIILDIMMPKRSGLSMYKELRATSEFQDIPIAMISGMTPDQIENSLKQRMTDNAIPPPESFIEKPIDIDKFIKYIKKLSG
jgi:two-component system, OmpR family, phosphate regulon response regulator PhoB